MAVYLVNGHSLCSKMHILLQPQELESWPPLLAVLAILCEICKGDLLRVANGLHMEVQVPLENLKTHAVYEQPLYMMMPHEILHAVMGRNKFAGNTPFCSQGLNGLTKPLFEANCQRFNFAKEKCIPLGLWIDGVPVKWDRSESLTVVSLNFPGQVDPTFKRLKIPLTVLNPEILHSCKLRQNVWNIFLGPWLS